MAPLRDCTTFASADDRSGRACEPRRPSPFLRMGTHTRGRGHDSPSCMSCARPTGRAGPARAPRRLAAPAACAAALRRLQPSTSTDTWSANFATFVPGLSTPTDWKSRA